MENVAQQLKCTLRSGYYQFNLSPTVAKDAAEVELVYLHSSEPKDSSSPSHHNSPITPDSPIDDVTEHGIDASHLKKQRPSTRWKRQQIDDFVRKLGFLDESEIAQRQEIQDFLHQNGVSNTNQKLSTAHCECSIFLSQVAYKLFELFKKLIELGHPDYTAVRQDDSPIESETCLNVLELSERETPEVKYLPCFPDENDTRVCIIGY